MPEHRPVNPLFKPGNAPAIAVAALYVLAVRSLIIRVPWCKAHQLATTVLVGVVACAAILAIKWAAEKRPKA